MSESEHEFANLVLQLEAAEDGRAQLAALLDERHPIYQQRSSAAVVRMRGWILLALGRRGVTEAELIYILEELDTGRDAYLVAAAARALRNYPRLDVTLRPHLDRALQNIRDRDDALHLDRYGGVGPTGSFVTAVGELQETLRLIQAQPHTSKQSCCCSTQPALPVEPNAVRTTQLRREIPDTRFEDHNQMSVEFADFFVGRPTIVAFFYTRCNNQNKCSLTISKLAEIGRELQARNLDCEIRTAAITYDPEFDDADRIRQYAVSRRAQLNEHHRMLRPLAHAEQLREYFELGVNYVGSVVNRHRIELFILDRRGQVALSFQRMLWSPSEVVDAAVRQLTRTEHDDDRPDPPATSGGSSGEAVLRSTPSTALLSTAVSVGAAFFPKCSMCWAAYLSALSVAGTQQFDLPGGLLPILIGLMLANLILLYPGRAARRKVVAFGLAASGALIIVADSIGLTFHLAPYLGVGLIAIGSLLGNVNARVSHGRADPYAGEHAR